MEKILKLITLNKVFLIVFSTIMLGCYNPSDDISSFFVIDIKEGVQLQESINLNGNGLNNDFISVYIYSIQDSNILSYAKEKFQPYFYDVKDSNEILYSFLNNTNGYYERKLEDNRLKNIYIDFINKKMVYIVYSL